MIKLQAKRFELNFLLKFSDLKSNFTLTLGYLNPALNNWGLSYSYSNTLMLVDLLAKFRTRKQGICELITMGITKLWISRLWNLWNKWNH